MTKILILLIGIFFISHIQAQNLVDLEFNGRPYYISPDNTLKSLGKDNASVKPIYNGAGWKGTEIYLSTHANKSSIRIPCNDSIKFYIKFSAKTNPAKIIELVKGETEQNDRNFLFSITNGRGHLQKNTQDIPLTFKKISEGLYEVFVGKLEPGEYAFMPITENGAPHPLSSGIRISCFGID